MALVITVRPPLLARALSLCLSRLISSISKTEIQSVLKYSQLYIFHTSVVSWSHISEVFHVWGDFSPVKREREKRKYILASPFSFFSLIVHTSLQTNFLQFSSWLRCYVLDLVKEYFGLSPFDPSTQARLEDILKVKCASHSQTLLWISQIYLRI